MSTARNGGDRASPDTISSTMSSEATAPGTRVANERAADRLHTLAVGGDAGSDAEILMGALTQRQWRDRKGLPATMFSNLDFAYIELVSRVSHDHASWSSLSAEVRHVLLKHAATSMPQSGVTLSLLATAEERRPFLVQIWRLAATPGKHVDLDPSLAGRARDLRSQLGKLGGRHAQADFDSVARVGQHAARPVAPRVAAEPSALSANITDPAELKRRFDATHDHAMMRTLLQRRFHAQFDANLSEYSLRELWKVLALLPANQVARLHEAAGKDTPGGQYDGAGKITVHNLASANSVTNSHALRAKGHAVKWFDGAVRHEIGHAVDDALHIMETHKSSPAFGGWREHHDVHALAHELVSSSRGRISRLTDPSARAKAITDLAAFMTNRGAPVAAGASNALGAMHDTAVAVAERGLHVGDGHYSKLPALNGRCYFYNSYYSTWYSYSAEAVDRKVSDYQFFAPGEWFADAYKAFYDPAFGAHPAEHNGLEEKDPALAKFFLREVHVAKAPAPTVA